MANAIFRAPDVLLARLEADDLLEAQRIFDTTPDYHRALTGKNASPDAAQRCFEREPPKPQKGIRTFKYFMGIMPPPPPDRDLAEVVGVTDVFVGYPAYHITTIATFIIAGDRHRKGLGRAAIQALVAWLKQDHPAVRWLDASITDDNLPATKFLLANGFKRTDSWYPIEVGGKEKRVLRFEMKFT